MHDGGSADYKQEFAAIGGLTELLAPGADKRRLPRRG
jgi:hypothetical protein